MATRNAPTSSRERLGIPADAERVLVLTESSHWDPDWLFTADQYFRLGVRHTLDRVLDELERDPRRVWSADCVFFLAMYWDRCPANRERMAALIDEGRLRLTTSGVTTQDTLLPSTESILRDFLVGQEWLRARGMSQEPRLAYFPDSFGHSPALPSLLRAAGFDRTVVTRIDGGLFLGSDWESPSRFPRPDSSAERLTQAGSADFVWRDAAGAEVLAHWHPFTYGQGDMVASVGPIRWMRLPTSVPDRSDKRVARRLERQAAKLERLARTPYLLCPIGLDFIDPIRDLLALVDRYNERHYPETGLWVTNLGADDYLDLVGEHRDDLPVLELDPNPYWTGFYASRPELKRSHRRLGDELAAGEAEAVAAGPAIAARVAGELAEHWWTAAVGNHHDFVTGTAPDRVTRGEQEPWLHSSLAATERIAAALAASDGELAAAPTAEATPTGGPDGADPVGHTRTGDEVHLDTGRLTATVDVARGGCLREVAVDGRTVLSGLGADLVAYDDAGGLWRLGGEYRGGHFEPVDRVSDRRATVEVHELPEGAVEVEVTAALDGIAAVRRYRFEPGADRIAVTTRCAAADRRTITLAVPAPEAARSLTMDQPGGVVRRPPQRHFTPTFWPVASWCAVDGRSGPGLAVATDMSRALAVAPEGTVEVIVARNAVKEKAWGWLPIPACPASGHEPGDTTASIGLWWPETSDPAAVADVARTFDIDPARARAERAMARTVVAEDPAGGDAPATVEVVAVKPASRGDGIVIRLVDRSGQGSGRVRLTTPLGLARAAFCDVRERDGDAIEVRSGDAGSTVEVSMAGTVTSVRLVPV